VRACVCVCVRMEVHVTKLQRVFYEHPHWMR